MRAHDSSIVRFVVGVVIAKNKSKPHGFTNQSALNNTNNNYNQELTDRLDSVLLLLLLLNSLMKMVKIDLNIYRKRNKSEMKK